MDWPAVGRRIRKQREYLGYTRERFAELLEVTPKFCSDIELGVKGMSVPTLCKIASLLRLTTDYILFGKKEACGTEDEIFLMLQSCRGMEREYAEHILKTLLLAMNEKKTLS